MNVEEIIRRYSDWQRGDPAPADVTRDFEAILEFIPPDILGDGIEDAFRAEETPAFEEMVAQLYSASDRRSRAALLDTVLATVGVESRFSPEDAAQINARDVQELVRFASREHPELVHRVSEFYARNPALVRSLGADALAIALTRVARLQRH